MESERSENTGGPVQTANVTTITISPNISGSGVSYSVYGKNGPIVASGSALAGDQTVTVSGYDEYYVTFGGNCVFGNSVAIRSGLTATVTLALTTSQG